MSEGSFPLRRFDRRLRTLRASNFPRVLAGIGPTSPTPGSRRERTRVPPLVQLMPTQDVQAGVAGFQLSFGSWGTAAANARSACLSEFKSPSAKGRRVSMTKINGSS